MARHCNGVVLSIGLAISLLQGAVLTAQQSKQVPPAPVPQQIVMAKKVFVANAGSEDRSPDEPEFSGSAERAYNQFYAAMKTWGKYELTSVPADADLVFEIQFTMPPISRAVFHGDSTGAASYDPQFRVVIRDPKTNSLLWGFTEHVQWALFKGNRDKNFDLAMAKIVADVQSVSGSAVAALKGKP